MKRPPIQLTIAYVTIAGTLLNTCLAAIIEWFKSPSDTQEPASGGEYGYIISAAVIVTLAAIYIAVLLYFTRSKK